MTSVYITEATSSSVAVDPKQLLLLTGPHSADWREKDVEMQGAYSETPHVTTKNQLIGSDGNPSYGHWFEFTYSGPSLIKRVQLQSVINIQTTYPTEFKLGFKNVNHHSSGSKSESKTVFAPGIYTVSEPFLDGKSVHLTADYKPPGNNVTDYGVYNTVVIQCTKVKDADKPLSLSKISIDNSKNERLTVKGVTMVQYPADVSASIQSAIDGIIVVGKHVAAIDTRSAAIETKVATIETHTSDSLVHTLSIVNAIAMGFVLLALIILLWVAKKKY